MGKDKTYHLLPFASVHKTFGNNGELIIKLFDSAPEEINLKEPVFITIDGCPVPFFFKQFDPRGNSRALVIFDDMETQALAEELVGKVIKLKMENGELKMKMHNKDNVSPIFNFQFSIFNYEVVDEAAGAIGTVRDFMDIPGNPCLLVMNGDNEVIIPCREELIVKADHKKKTITMQLPEGLVELNNTKC